MFLEKHFHGRPPFFKAGRTAVPVRRARDCFKIAAVFLRLYVETGA